MQSRGGIFEGVGRVAQVPEEVRRVLPQRMVAVERTVWHPGHPPSILWKTGANLLGGL